MKYVILIATLTVAAITTRAQPKIERPSRGAVAVHQPDGAIFASWRLPAVDVPDVAFNLYRDTGPTLVSTSTNLFHGRGNRK